MSAALKPEPQPVIIVSRESLIDLETMERAYKQYHGSPQDTKESALKYYEEYRRTGELPFFAKRVLGIL